MGLKGKTGKEVMNMRCPQCGIEMTVHSRTAGPQGVLLRFACRNRRCPAAGRVMAERQTTDPKRKEVK